MRTWLIPFSWRASCCAASKTLRRAGSRRPSLADAVKEALGVGLPKTSQLSPWWRDRLTQEQIAYAALDVVFALKLEAALTPRIAELSKAPDGKTLQTPSV